MGSSHSGKLTTVLFVVIVVGACALLSSCGGTPQGGSTSTINATVEDIVWPDKYFASADPSGFSATVSVTYEESRQAVYLWAKTYHRLEVSEQGGAFVDTFLAFYDNGTYDITLPYYTGGDGSGIYELTVGICEDVNKKYSKKDAIDWQNYQFFVGGGYAEYHDVDIEYHYQSGCWLFSNAAGFKSWVRDAFKNTLVVFNIVERTKTLTVESVTYTPDEFLIYRESHGEYWDPGDYEVPKYRFFLCGVDRFVDDFGNELPNTVGGGFNGRNGNKLYEMAMVAVGKIRELFPSDAESYVKIQTTAHEIGHIIGAGLPEGCHAAAYEHSSFSCLMNWFQPAFGSSYGFECYCDDNTELFHGTFEFCAICEARLSDLYFLKQD